MEQLLGAQKPSCWVMKAFTVPAVAQRLKLDNSDPRRLQDVPAVWSNVSASGVYSQKAHRRWDIRRETSRRPAHSNAAADADEIWLAGLSFRLCCWLSHPAHRGLFLARQWMGAQGDASLTGGILALHRTYAPGCFCGFNLGWSHNWNLDRANVRYKQFLSHQRVLCVILRKRSSNKVSMEPVCCFFGKGIFVTITPPFGLSLKHKKDQVKRQR